ncbi:SIR2 family protein [Rhodococcus sp. IEGM1428]|uniref:SIR2 family protein n=1 Tax=Rhodococcus sp. IEGM1428 TaxID=3392191 RepID=UPI003D0D7671
MSAVEIQPRTVGPLAALSTDSHVSVLLGAGASVAAGLPDWNTFAIELLVNSGAIKDRATAGAFLEGQDPAIAAEAAKQAAGADWPNLLRSTLYGDTPVDPAPLHAAAAALAAARDPSSISLFTLNYDDLLEESLRGILDQPSDPKVFSRWDLRPRASPSEHEVHHLHGLLPRAPSTAEAVVLTLGDYHRLGQKQAAWQVSALQEAIQKGPLILAGTSYRDPDIRQWIHDLISEDDDAKVLVFLAREGMKLGREQFELVRGALEMQWSALGVQVVATHDHADAAQALRELPYINGAGYAAPSQRAAHLWQVHVDQFTMFQEGDSDELEQDLLILQEQLPDFGNLTLWVADSNGSLVRWAANDRVYRSPNHLRRVLTGHDSYWIAGQCLGRNDTLIKDVEGPASTARWRSVVAVPVVVDLCGGPPLPCAVISGASTKTRSDAPLDELSTVFAELSEKWSSLLKLRHDGL